MAVDVLASQIRMLPSAYPTAKTSGSISLLQMTVTSSVQLASRHLLNSSPFFTSQQRTSSFAAAYARPAPEDLVPGCTASAAQTRFEVAVATTPKASLCSYLLCGSQWKV